MPRKEEEGKRRGGVREEEEGRRPLAEEKLELLWEEEGRRRGSSAVGPPQGTSAPRPEVDQTSAVSPKATTYARMLFDGMFTLTGEIDLWISPSDVELRVFTIKRKMKIVLLRWMREWHKLGLICDHHGPHKQFHSCLVYTTWFTNPKNTATPCIVHRPKGELPKP
ncbi:hypothetical protein HU200_033125 [Digitaria exilis]|uniref:Uncharacterized protein n=1 Tax=Digitaria exilis TaxID=1010633 RepID=A0A835ENI4_9POAL|nr:hypothetical protein HU200_033125 [Digitaria exilis]